MFRFNDLFDLFTEKHPPSAGAFLVENLKIERKAIKHLYLRINPTDGQVYVTAPQQMGDHEIAQFLEQKQHWIARKRQQLQDKIQLFPIANHPLDQIRLWGDIYTIICVQAKAHSISVDRVQGRLRIAIPDIEDEQSIRSLLNRWLRNQLHQRISQRLPVFEALSHTCVKEWRIKAMKTRWGTCNFKAGRVWINAELVQLPPECLDYILLHELVHLHEPSHNARFHRLVGEFMPHWRESDALLNRYLLPR